MGHCPLCGGPTLVGHSLESCARWLELQLELRVLWHR